MDKKIIGIVVLFLLVLQSAAVVRPTITHATGKGIEYKLKAAFLLNFAKFTIWPETASAQQSFKLCILGESPFGPAFSGIEQKTIGSKPVTLIVTEDLDSASTCHLVYISNSEKERLDSILQTLHQKHILVVSDIEAFAAEGGIIEFVEVDNRLGFIINQTQAKEAKLNINASLLNLATKVL